MPFRIAERLPRACCASPTAKAPRSASARWPTCRRCQPGKSPPFARSCAARRCSPPRSLLRPRARGGTAMFRRSVYPATAGLQALLAARPSPERELSARWWPRASSPRTPSWRPRAGGTPRRWPRTSASPTGRGRPLRGDGLAARAPGRIQKKLAARHLSAGALVLYDLSSSYFEGSCCPLAKLGYSRDGNAACCRSTTACSPIGGCPVAVSVHEGNVAEAAP